MAEIFLSIVLPWLILSFLVIFTVALILKLPEGIMKFVKLPYWAVAGLLLAFFAGAWLRFAYVPLDHRIYFDEDRYLSYAVTFARFGKAVTVDYATLQKSIIGIPDEAVRTTVPVLNAVVMKIAGYSEHNLFITAKYLSSVQIILVFIVGLLLTDSPFVATMAAFGMAFMPSNVFWSVSIGLDGYFVFFSLLSMTSALLFGRNPSLVNKILLASSIFLLLCVRLESFLMLPVIAGTIALQRTARNKAILTKKDSAFLLVIFLLVALRGAASVSVLGKKWCCAEALPLEAFSASYLARNILPNLIALFILPEVPFVLTLLAGGALLSKPDMKIKFLLFAWFLLYFFIYSFYYAGTFYTAEFSGSYGRYFLMLIPPLLLLASIGIKEAGAYILTRKKHWMIIAGIAGCIILLYPTVIVYSRIIKVSPFDRIVEAGPRQIHNYMTDKIISGTPPNSLILYNLTAYILLRSRQTMFIGLLTQNKKAVDYFLNELKKGTPVYMPYPYECELFPDRCTSFFPLLSFKEILPVTNTEPGLMKVTLKKK